jgi:hypothetical protein
VLEICPRACRVGHITPEKDLRFDILTKLGLADRLMPKWERFVDWEPKIQPNAANSDV